MTKGKKRLRKFGIGLLVIVGLIAIVLAAYNLFYWNMTRKARALLGAEPAILIVDGINFRDLNKNGDLDPYEDTRLSPEVRADDLLSRMTLEEKAGLMFLEMIGIRKDGTVIEKQAMMNKLPATVMIADLKLNHFTLMATTDARGLAEWNNAMQQIAERTRLGIPISFHVDPRNEVQGGMMPFDMVGDFSQGPTPLGFAATFDPELVAQFGDVIRQEYTAVGFRVAQHPQADLATEPRWTRLSYTFGEDAEIASEMVAAFTSALQGDELGSESVAVMVKHFPGAGPQNDGGDAHYESAKDQAYPGNNFEYHLKPFEAAFDAGAAMVMPYYATPGVLPFENAGFAFNHDILTGLLREEMGYKGVITSDFGLLSGLKMFGIRALHPPAWGVEGLTVDEKVAKGILAGLDQFGGEHETEILINLVNQGILTEARIDESVRRLLLVKFKLGLFDNPFVDPDLAEKIVGQTSFQEIGDLAQRRSMVLLQNDDNLLPLESGIKIYVEGIDPDIADQFGSVVKKPEDADFAILRISSPVEASSDGGLFARIMSRGGDLDFKGKDKEKILDLLDTVPTIVVIRCDRPAVIPEIAEKSAGLFAEFGASDEAILDLVFGKFNPSGKLPIAMPATMDSVYAQFEDVPFDVQDPLFEYGFGLSYEEMGDTK